MQRLKGKSVIVFGSASGIGAASAVRLAAEGARVCLADVNIDGAKGVATQIQKTGGEAIAVACDIADEASVKAAVDSATSVFGGLNGAHINAADMQSINKDFDALEIDLAIFDRMMSVNLRGHLLCTRAVLPQLLKKGRGSIVYTSSPASDAGEPTRVAYAVSKSGINALMRHVASRWGAAGINANCVSPGLTLTASANAAVGEDFKKAMLARMANTRLGTPEDQAAMVALLMSEDGDWINGQIIRVDGGPMR
jgi:NAD(P)-dependent dehydrogenase (short-subunit alcohol dehydrogenase family)